MPAVVGATYVTLLPDPEIAPPETDHVTAVFELLLTLAVKDAEPPLAMVAVLGLRETATLELLATFTVADADCEVSLTLVAFTV